MGYMTIDGCSISWSMFGDRQLLNVNLSVEYAFKLQAELKALSDGVNRVYNEKKSQEIEPK